MRRIWRDGGGGGGCSAARSDVSVDQICRIDAIQIACSLALLTNSCDFFIGRPVVQPLVRERSLKRRTKQSFIASGCFVQRRRDPVTRGKRSAGVIS